MQTGQKGCGQWCRNRAFRRFSELRPPSSWRPGVGPHFRDKELIYKALYKFAFFTFFT